jgi:lysophospholipase L1-like esterase
MMKSALVRLLAAVLVFTLGAVPLAAARGSADFTRYVALGDSLTGGSVSANPINLVVTHQLRSFPALIARQAGTPDFQMPLISEPGILPELVLVSLSPLIIAPKSPVNGFPMNHLLPRPYNNLGIPAARVGDLLTLTGAEPHPNPFFQIILRRQAPAVQQALALSPTFMTIWVGNNDVLGGVTSGRPSTMTPIDDFTRDYTAMINALTAGAPSAGMVVATVPPIDAIPFVTLVPPFLIDPATQLPVIVGGQPVYYVAETNGTVAQLGPGSAVLLTAMPLLAQGYGIPPGIPSNLPFAGTPLPDAVVLTTGELAEVRARQQQVNAAIRAAAASKSIPVLDVEGLFTKWKQGQQFAGIRLSLDFLTGGLISYDGIHPTELGYAVIANEFIRLINREYSASIPEVSLMEYFDYNAVGFAHGEVIRLDDMQIDRMITLDDLSRTTSRPKPVEEGFVSQ